MDLIRKNKVHTCKLKIIDPKIIEFKRPHSKKACFKESKDFDTVKRGEKTHPFRSSFTVTFLETGLIFSLAWHSAHSICSALNSVLIRLKFY